MMFVLLVAGALLAVGCVFWPFVRQSVLPVPGGEPTHDTREELRLQQAAAYEALRDLEYAYQSGQYTQEDYHHLRLHYEQQAAAILQALDHQPQTPAVSSSHVSTAGQRKARSGTRWLRLGLVLGVLVLCGLGAGYWLGGTTSASPDLPVLLAAADAALVRGDVSGAIHQYRAVLEQAPGNVMALTKLGILARRAGHSAIGLRLIERALQQQPTYSPAWQAKGFMHYDQGDYQKAIAAWETYLGQTSDDNPHRQTIAQLIEQARQHLQ